MKGYIPARFREEEGFDDGIIGTEINLVHARRIIYFFATLSGLGLDAILTWLV